MSKREDGQEVGQHIVDFSTAHDFRALFALLDAKGTLWGSQKRYTAAELKVLISRVRSRNPALQLPLQLIPRTAGLQQRVTELLESELSKNAAANCKTNNPQPVE